MIVKYKSLKPSPLLLTIIGLLVATMGCSMGGLLVGSSPATSPTPIVVVLTPTPLPPSLLSEVSAAQQ